MEMESVNITDAQSRFADLIERASKGEDFLICTQDGPKARLVPYSTARRPRQPGSWAGKVVIQDGFSDLPPDIQSAFEVDTGE